MPLGLVGVRQECRRRRAAAEGGSRYGQATGADGVGRPAVVGGCCSSWRRAAMEGSALGGCLFSPRRTCTPLHSQVSQTLPFARHWTNTPPAPLGLAQELQIHEICSVRRTRVVLDG